MEALVVGEAVCAADIDFLLIEALYDTVKRIESDIELGDVAEPLAKSEERVTVFLRDAE